LVNPGSTTYTLNLGGTYQEVIASGGGTLSDSQINASGNYIGGSLTYQDAGSITLAGGSAAIFLNTPLTVTTPAKASANPVAGMSVGLSVLGQENGSGSGLTYTWSSSGPASVTFSDNGDTSAASTKATFTEAGTYTFTATISNGTQTVTSSVTVAVKQTLTSLQVSPGSASVVDGATQQFSALALDQFGNPLTPQPTITWSIKTGGIGTILKGLYTAPKSKVGPATVQAQSGTLSASAAVTVVASGSATFLGADTTDQGNWQQAYGAQGYDIIGASFSIPTYATVTATDETKKVWSTTTTNVSALSNPAGGRIEANWYALNSFSVNVDITDGQTHEVALYFLDVNDAARSERVDVLNSAGQVLDSRTISSFGGGQYMVWNISGNVTFRITRLAGPSAVMSGLFFGGPSN
jgi:hypothetical protein